MTLIELLNNKIVISFIIAWAVSQGSKSIIDSIKNKKLTFRSIYHSGGMPSSHNASTGALSTAVGLIEGFNSTLFSVCLIFSLIIFMDSVGVRRSTGINSIAINKVLKKEHEHTVSEYKGHTIPQAFVGLGIGITSAILVVL